MLSWSATLERIGNRHLARFSKQDFSGCGRLRGGAGRTRTNHQNVMEHGWRPTNSPGRTPIQIAGRFAVLLDFPAFLYLINYQSVMDHGSSPTNSPGRTPPDRLAARHVGLFISVRLCGNDILLGLPPPLFSAPKIPFPGNREPDCGDPGAEDESARLR